MKKVIIHTVIIGTMPLFLTGCIEAVVAGVTSTSYAVAEERTVGNVVDDNVIWTHIHSLYVQEDVNDLLKNVDIKVNEGRVLLTGNVGKSETRVKAVRIAWQPDGVREVINELQVSNKSDLKDFAKDTWISAQVKGKLLISKEIRSINYSVETVNGTVYLIGIAQDKRELQKATHVASTVKGVKNVISHMRLKDDPLRG